MDRIAKIVIVLLVAVAFIGAPIFTSWGQTISWANPVQYENGATISAEDQARLRTHLYRARKPNGPWIRFAVVVSGTTTWQGTLPRNKKNPFYYTMRQELDGRFSDFMMPAIKYPE